VALPLLLAGAFAVLPGRSAEAVRAQRIDASRPAEPLTPGARRALLDTYAPLVLLASGERALPAHAEWYLAQSKLEPGHLQGSEAARAWSPDARLRPSHAARGGSPDAADWTVYGHVYRADDGGVLVQYWFFYAFNKFHGFGDHEADWEHVTVRIGADGRPLGAWYAHHDDNAPGAWVPWRWLSREGTHPVVLSAEGTHASYARRSDVPFYDSTCSSARVEEAGAGGCRVWRTWSGTTGGVRDLGTRDAPGTAYLLWPGRWGAEAGLDDDGAGPPGPAFQPGWCSRGAAGCA
jgi:hypothetical protein